MHILINKAKGVHQYLISSSHPIFRNEYIKVDISYDCVVFSIPDIDYSGKMYKTIKNHSGWRNFGVTNELLCTGKFQIDLEETTEDELVIYIR